MTPAVGREEHQPVQPPPDRDLVVDLVRVGAISAVVLGHWLVAGLE